MSFASLSHKNTKKWFKRGYVCFMFVLVAPSNSHHENDKGVPFVVVFFVFRWNVY